MEWHKKTDEQYNSQVTLLNGGDVETEAHFDEDEWASITFALENFIDLLDGETTLDAMIGDFYTDPDAIRSFKDAMKKIRKNEEHMVAPHFLDTYRAITEAM